MDHMSSHHHNSGNLNGAWVEADNEEGTEPVEGSAKGGAKVLMMIMLNIRVTMLMTMLRTMLRTIMTKIKALKKVHDYLFNLKYDVCNF